MVVYYDLTGEGCCMPPSFDRGQVNCLINEMTMNNMRNQQLL